MVAPQLAVGQDDVEWFPIDKIVAVVGAVPITESQLTQELLGVFQGRGGMPEDSAEVERLKHEVLQRMINEEVLVQEANSDTTVTVTTLDVTEAVDEKMAEIRDQFNSETEYEIELKAAGFENAQHYREYLGRRQLRDMLRTNLITTRQQMGDVREIPPTQAEMRAYYDANINQWQARPATVNFRQIVVKPQADSAAFADAMRLADSLVAALRDGGDFAEAARTFSEDPGSKDLGGDLGFFRRGRMHRDFENVAFRLRPGNISNPFLSPFGIHIVEVLRREPAEVHARHILIIPHLTTQNNVDAREMADSIAVMLANGLPLDSLTRIYHDDSEQAVVEDMPEEALPPLYGEVFAQAVENDIVGPLQLQYGPEFTKHSVILYQGRREPGLPTFEDVRDQIRSLLSREAGIKRYVETLRANTYIDIRLPPPPTGPRRPAVSLN